MLRATGAQVDDAEARSSSSAPRAGPPPSTSPACCCATATRSGRRARSGRTIRTSSNTSATRSSRTPAPPTPRSSRARRSSTSCAPRSATPCWSASDSADRLRALVDANLLVTPGDVYGTTFRVHALFRSLLRAELRREGPEAERALHRRAAAVFRERQDWERAIRHALAAGDDGDAADIVWEVGVRDDRRRTRRDARALVPAGSATRPSPAHPQIALARGWVALEAGEAETASRVRGDRPRVAAPGPARRRCPGAGDGAAPARGARAVGQRPGRRGCRGGRRRDSRGLPAARDRAPRPRIARAARARRRSSAQELLEEAKRLAIGTRPDACTRSCSPTWRCSRSTADAGTRPTRSSSRPGRRSAPRACRTTRPRPSCRRPRR